jgi:AraC-like DNA-binding protein
MFSEWPLIGNWIGHAERKASRAAKGGLSPWQLRRVYDFIEKHPGMNPSISELASECGISESHLARSFRRTVGMAPHEWLIKRRVQRAKELLMIAGGLSLAEISLTCGFVDQSHFTRVFSKHEGKSPGTWRRHSAGYAH